MHRVCWGFVLVLVVTMVMAGGAAPAPPPARVGAIAITAHAEYPSRFFQEFYREFSRVVEEWWEKFGKYDAAGRWGVAVWETVVAGERLPIVISVRKVGDWPVKPLIVPREDSDPVLSARIAAEKTMQKIEMWGWKRNLIRRSLEEGARWLLTR